MEEEVKTPAETVEAEKSKNSSVIVTIFAVIKNLFRLVFKFFESVASGFYTVFSKLGLIRSTILFTLFALICVGIYVLGYQNGKAFAVDELAKEYNITEDRLYDILEVVTR